MRGLNVAICLTQTRQALNIILTGKIQLGGQLCSLPPCPLKDNQVLFNPLRPLCFAHTEALLCDIASFLVNLKGITVPSDGSSCSCDL